MTTYVTVAHFRNNAEKPMSIFLEMLCQEVILSPGHEVDLLVKEDDAVQPLTINYSGEGVQIFGHEEGDPEWHVRFKDQLIRAGHPTTLSDYESK